MWNWIIGEWVLWALTVLAAVIYARFLWQKITVVVTYALSLLLCDPFRENEKLRFQQWMKTEDWRKPGMMAIRTAMFVMQAAETQVVGEPMTVQIPREYVPRRAA